jgi:hypothetical protein
MKSTLIKILPLALALAGAVSTFAADVSTSVETKKVALTTKTVEENKLSPASLKVVRLLQSGMDEKVVVAYVKNNPAPAAPTAEELVYLHQLGVPSPVLTALLTETRKSVATEVVAAAPVPVAAPSEKVEVTSNYTPLPGAPQPEPTQVNGSTVISSPSPQVVVQQQQPTVVYTQPAPVVVEAPPVVVYEPRPVITFGFGFGHRGYYGHHYGGRHHGWHR